MPVTIPSKETIYQGILNDYASEMGVDVSELGDQIRVEAKVQAGREWVMYLLISKVQNNMYPDLAEEEELIRDGLLWLGRVPSPAEQGQYSCVINGKGGSIIPASTQFKSDSTSTSPDYLFILDSEFTMPGTIGVETSSTITIRALEAGLDAQLLVGDTLTSIQPLNDFTNQITVDTITVQPVSAEGIESYRADVEEAKRLQSQGGSPSDYRLWCSEVPEIRTSYPYLQQGGGGNIIIYVEATEENTAPGEITGVPTQATLEEVYKFDSGIETGVVVQDPITSIARRPVQTKNISSVGINPNPVDLYFTDYSDESKIGLANNAIDEFLYNVRPYVSGADVLSRKNDILTIGAMLSAIYDALQGSGVTFTSLAAKVNGVDLDPSYQFLLGNIPYLRDTYNDGGIV